VRLANGLVGRVQTVGSAASNIFSQPDYQDSRLEDAPARSNLSDWIGSALDEKKDDTPKGPWTCSACTYENAAWRLSCEMCGGVVKIMPKESQETEGREEESWTCGDCTFENSDSSRCEMCEKER
jgi:hypothetical protein